LADGPPSGLVRGGTISPLVRLRIACMAIFHELLLSRTGVARVTDIHRWLARAAAYDRDEYNDAEALTYRAQSQSSFPYSNGCLTTSPSSISPTVSCCHYQGGIGASSPRAPPAIAMHRGNVQAPVSTVAPPCQGLTAERLRCKVLETGLPV